MPARHRGPQSSTRSAPPANASRVAPYEMIKQAILNGELAPGQLLVETALAEWCGVSRTPVREALRRLEQDGLIDRSSHGLVVRKRSPEEILDLYDTRIVLEATAARFAADRRTDHDVRLLRQTLERGRQTDTSDVGAMVAVNRQFHAAVWRASHNQPLTDMLERLNLHLGRYPGTTLSAPHRWDVARDEHALLVDAIEQRNAGRAYEIATTHFSEAREIRLQLFATEDSVA